VGTLDAGAVETDTVDTVDTGAVGSDTVDNLLHQIAQQEGDNEASDLRPFRCEGSHRYSYEEPDP